MSAAFDRELNHANDTEMVFDDDYERDDEDEPTYGTRPDRAAKPRTINLADLTRNDGAGAEFGRSTRSPVPRNLTNRVPGISEMLDADSEVLRDLSRKRTTHFNPTFLEQKRAQRTTADARLDENRDHLYDKAEREQRQEQREKLREARHRREMQQRSKFHKYQAKTGEEMQTTLQSINDAMVARTNQLGTLIEEVRSDLLEAQIEQQNAHNKLIKQLAMRDAQVKSQMSWLMVVSCAALLLLFIAFVCKYVWPAVRNRFFGAPSQAVYDASGDVVDNKADEQKPTPDIAVAPAKPAATVTGVGKPNVVAVTMPRPSALDTSEDLSIGI